MHFTSTDLAKLDRPYQRDLINTVSGPRSANLIGTANSQGQTNLAIFNTVTHIGANPPCLAFILRPTSVERHTYNNLKATGYYTINAVHRDILAAAHQTSAKYPDEVSEFDACGLTAQSSTQHTAPYVQESRIKIGLKFVEEHLIAVHQTRLIVGEIVELLVDDEILSETGHLQLAVADSLAVGGLDCYYGLQNLGRQPHAKP